jgi:hypothetical protein
LKVLLASFAEAGGLSTIFIESQKFRIEPRAVLGIIPGEHLVVARRNALEMEPARGVGQYRLVLIHALPMRGILALAPG